jgi:protein-disulfide isomerase
MSQTSSNKKWYKKWWGITALVFLGVFLVFVNAFAFQVLYYYKKIKSGEIVLPQITKGTLVVRTSHKYFNSQEADDPYLGNPDAKHTIVLFSDFECPNSKKAATVVREIGELYKDKIKIIFRDFPLSEIHPNARLAANAANCSHEQGKFWAMHDKIFQNQDDISFSKLTLYAAQIGLNVEKFKECLSSEKYNLEITKDILDGTASGVSGTPTWFIDGEKVEGAIPLEAFQKIINYLLASED